MAIPNINLANGNKNAIDSGTIKTSGTTKGGGVGASTNTQGPLHIFNPVVKLFRELQQNYQGVKTKKLWS